MFDCIKPTQKAVSCSYGGYKGHVGTDYACYKEPVKAIADGIVLSAIKNGKNTNWGNEIWIDHGSDSEGNFYKTRYIHLDRFLVGAGGKVEKGEDIAISGNSGRNFQNPKEDYPYHLHFELWVKYTGSNKYIPIDFEDFYLKKQNKIMEEINKLNQVISDRDKYIKAYKDTAYSVIEKTLGNDTWVTLVASHSENDSGMIGIQLMADEFVKQKETIEQSLKTNEDLKNKILELQKKLEEKPVEKPEEKKIDFIIWLQNLFMNKK